ncbi:AEC family transporter [Bremerella sp. JC770]|uniref:AEC family transporter n=1 Tax=Bremerella sp. JC770 TaxID=3232137 RepID=UPI0034587495
MNLTQVITILSITAAVFTVMGIGGTARYLNWISREVDAGLLKLGIRVLMPCFIFVKVVGNPAFDEAANVYLPPVWGFLAVALGCFVAYSWARGSGARLGFDHSDKVHTFAVCIGIFNYGFIPIPLVQEIFGERALGVLFLHNVGVELGIWTIGVSLASGGLTKGWWKNVLNPPSLTIIVSLIINEMGWAELVPEFVTQITGILASAAIPMMMLLIGATFFDQIFHADVQDDKSSPWPTYVSAVVLRLLLLPILFLLAALCLPISLELKQVAAIQAAMPAAVFPIVLTKHYGGDPRTALRVVMASTVIGFVTIPIWISTGIDWLGLETTVLQQTSQEVIVAPQLEPLQQAIHVAGISVRTTNREEMNPGNGQIPKLYQKYEADNIDALITDPVDPKQRIAVYADYESDQSGEFTMLLGRKVSAETEIPDQLDKVRIHKGNYLHFVGEGEMPQVVPSTWQEIWNYFEGDTSYRRTFEADFEIYDQASPNRVDIFIAVE